MGLIGHSGYDTLILDIGDVLLTRSRKANTSTDPKTLRALFSSSIWFDYECGRLSEAECYAALADQYGLETSKVRQALNDARASLRVNEELVAEIHALKSASGRRLRVFAFANISKSDWEFLFHQYTGWDSFDAVFTSFSIGERKPALFTYRHVLSKGGINPAKAILIDNRIENIVSARSLGITGIRFDNTANVIRQLRNLIGDPVRRGREFLRKNAGQMDSETEAGTIIRDNFAQLLILDLTQNKSLVYVDQSNGTWNLYQEGSAGVSTNDFNTTSLAYIGLKRLRHTADAVLDEISTYAYLDPDKIVPVSSDRHRHAVDPTVSCNILRFFYHFNRGQEVTATLNYVDSILRHRAYLDGTHHHPSPDSFLYFLTRLVHDYGDKNPDLRCQFQVMLRERLRERVNKKGCALSIAMRARACQMMGISAAADVKSLQAMQCDDGGWPMVWYRRCGQTGLRMGNRGVTTAMAVDAIATHIRESSPSSFFTPRF
ncbi:HAD-like protein [Pluteus cervinus]|uniref:HAD-like protein n=1 Tax=Pluteus cervinus TaxID=181527 RepID=A0ACD3AIN0_9AGAR|nr:HAD-like protein [Pluteus cervinus]